MTPRHTTPVPRLWPILGIALALAALATPRTVPVHAQSDDVPQGYTDVRLTQSVTVYAEPDATAAVVAVLEAGTVVTGFDRALGPDGTRWRHVSVPTIAGAMGWMRAEDFATGTPVFDIVGM